MRNLGLALLTAMVTAALPGPAAAQSGRLDLPVVLIDAPEGIVDEPKRPATVQVLDRRGQEDYSGPAGIELRGFTSQSAPKKSYGVETRKRSGEHRNVSLLGMPADDDWVLVASYWDESLHLRNRVAYSTARWLGRYVARTRLVEVGLNGNYEGVYLLAEDLKLHERRVAVDDSDVSGGYLLEMLDMQRIERTPESEQFFTTPVQRQAVVYDDPSLDDLPYARADWIRD